MILTAPAELKSGSFSAGSLGPAASDANTVIHTHVKVDVQFRGIEWLIQHVHNLYKICKAYKQTWKLPFSSSVNIYLN